MKHVFSQKYFESTKDIISIKVKSFKESYYENVASNGEVHSLDLIYINYQAQIIWLEKKRD